MKTLVELNALIDNPEKVKVFLNNINTPTSIKNNLLASQSVEATIKQKTNNKINSLDELISEFNSLKNLLEQSKKTQHHTRPAFIARTAHKNNTKDLEAIKRSNEIARMRIRAHLKTVKENGINVYDVGSWTKTTNTIIENIKKNGISIGLVTKGADNGIAYFNSAEREFLADTKKFTELWVHSNGEVFQITLGEILKNWSKQGIKTNMFDLN
ncbi:MAG: hypothetical protein AB8G86_03850 [Saprospiraceae bacterium]